MVGTHATLPTQQERGKAQKNTVRPFLFYEDDTGLFPPLGTCSSRQLSPGKLRSWGEVSTAAQINCPRYRRPERSSGPAHRPGLYDEAPL